MGSTAGLLRFWDSLRPVMCILLVLASAFFVAAEYALVGARRSRIEAVGKKGGKTAKQLSVALRDISSYIAATQIGITMLGIAIGSFTEPYVSGWLASLLLLVDPSAIKIISYLLVVFVLLVVGELCPKYLALRHADRLALLVFPALKLITAVLKPLIFLAQATAGLILRPFRVDIHLRDKDAMPKEELLMLVQSGGVSGILDKLQADMVSRALRLDVLDAKDIMIHRLDIQWLDAGLTKGEILSRLKEIPYSRMPVCRADIDDLVGVVYLHDIVKHVDDESFELERIMRPVVAVPENLQMARILELMRVEKTQMLIVMDEYGGTSGLVTLEDVVEEVFGELEDRLESERRPIEIHPNGRISARADVRIDELVAYTGIDLDLGESTDTLATMVIDQLGRVPRTGDSVASSIGTMRVENMARRRITRVSIHLAPGLTPHIQSTD
ncbi:MAG: hemolysin family protein [Fimbriimonas sp.]|nr:hemolysin family protein [Fimbriimonas sp.]